MHRYLDVNETFISTLLKIFLACAKDYCELYLTLKNLSISLSYHFIFEEMYER